MTFLSRSIRSLLSRVSLLTLPAALLLGGCALNHADRSILAEHGVPAPLREKMAHIQPLTLPEIVELSRQGMLPEYITEYLRATHHVYTISDHDGYWLNRAGVSSTVISYLFSSPAILERPSDRWAAVDWSPYFVPSSESFNTFGHDYYYTGSSRKSSFRSVAQAKAQASEEQ